MSENLQKLIGVVVMAVLVVVGVVVSSGDDTDFSRNWSFRATPGTFAGADRVKEADCCDENAYRISQLEKQVSSLEAELADVQQLQPSIVSFLKAFPPGQDSLLVKEAAANVWDACKGEDYGLSPYRIGNCWRQLLVGLEIGFAKAVVAFDPDGLNGRLAPKFAVFHRSSKADNQSPEIITTEACAPIFMNGETSLVALDTVGGVVAHPLNFSFWPPPGVGSSFAAKVRASSLYETGSSGSWEQYAVLNGLC